MRNVKSLGCGAYHSLIVGLGDKVYACGLNNYGQLGLGPLFESHPQQNYLTMAPLLCNKGIISLKGGVHHSLALSSTGDNDNEDDDNKDDDDSHSGSDSDDDCDNYDDVDDDYADFLLPCMLIACSCCV